MDNMKASQIRLDVKREQSLVLLTMKEVESVLWIDSGARMVQNFEMEVYLGYWMLMV